MPEKRGLKTDEQKIASTKQEVMPFVTAPILPALVRFALPILGAVFLQTMYGAVDMLVAVLFCMIGYFNGREQTLFVMLQGIAGAFGVRIPVSYLMSRIEPVSLFGVGMATPCSSVVQILLCVGYLIMLKKRSRKKSTTG